MLGKMIVHGAVAAAVIGAAAVSYTQLTGEADPPPATAKTAQAQGAPAIVMTDKAARDRLGDDDAAPTHGKREKREMSRDRHDRS